MGKLEDQLARADKQARKERGAAVEPEDVGGPVDGEHDDSHLAFHATLPSRGLVLGTSIVAVIVIFGVAAPLWAGERRIGIMIAVGCVALVALAIAYHLYRRTRAPADVRAYLAGLSFTLRGYIETMRQPRWRAKHSHIVKYQPTLEVTWASDVDAHVVAKLVRLVKAKYETRGTRAGTFAHEYGEVGDPWTWTREVIAEVIVPLAERTQVEHAQLRIARTIEERESGA